MSSIISKDNCEFFITSLSYNKTSALRQRNLCNSLKKDNLKINFVEGIVFRRWSKENSFILLLNLLKEFEKSDLEYGLICQDDFYPIDNFLYELNKTVELLPEDWECLHLCPGAFWGRRFRDKSKIGQFFPENHIKNAIKRNPNTFESHESNRFFINCIPRIYTSNKVWLGGPIAMLLNKKYIKNFIAKYKDTENFDHEDRILVKILNDKSFICKDPQLGYEEPCNGTTFKSHKNKYITIGSSDTNVKKIKLEESYPTGTKLSLIHNYEDTFSYDLNDDELIVTRTDKDCGWDHELIAYF